MTLKTEAIEAIKGLPDKASLGDIQYRLYVISKIKKSEASVKKGRVHSHTAAGKRLSKWLSK